MSLLVAYHGFDRLLSSIIDVESYDYRFRAGYTRARRKTLPLRSKTHESDSPLVESRRNKDTKTLSTIGEGSARKAGRRRCSSKDVGRENEGEE